MKNKGEPREQTRSRQPWWRAGENDLIQRQLFGSWHPEVGKRNGPECGHRQELARTLAGGGISRCWAHICVLRALQLCPPWGRLSVGWSCSGNEQRHRVRISPDSLEVTIVLNPYLNHSHSFMSHGTLVKLNFSFLMNKMEILRMHILKGLCER